MSFLLLVLIISIVFLVLYLTIKLRFLEKKLSNNEQNDILLDWVKVTGEGIKQTQQQVSKTIFELTSQLNQNQNNMNQRLDSTAKVVADVAYEVGQMNELGRSIREVHQLLTAPKLRGNLGEAILADILSQILPKSSYNLQHQFHDGSRVDALIVTDKGNIPIDAKFPLEQYAASLKKETEKERIEAMKEFDHTIRKHIIDISGKYLKPTEGTTDFALMYVPSEGVYYTIITDLPDVVTFAESRHIHIVSPHSFYFLLRIILMGLREKIVAERTQDILQALEGLRLDSRKLGETLSITNKHLNHAQSSLMETTTWFERFQKTLTRLVIESPKGNKLTNTEILPSPQENETDI